MCCTKFTDCPANQDLDRGPTWLQKSNRGPVPTGVLKTRPIEKNTHHFFKPNCRKLQNDSKNVSHKIGSKRPQKLGPLFSLFFMRKTLSSGRKWLLRPYFPLIRGTLLLRSGLRFLFWALEVPEPREGKRPRSLTNMAFSSLSVWELPGPETKIKDHFSIETYP